MFCIRDFDIKYRKFDIFSRKNLNYNIFWKNYIYIIILAKCCSIIAKRGLLNFMKNLIKTYLICDESGCKGFANNPIDNPNDIGVFAGYCIPEGVFSDVRNSVDLIADKYKNPEGKTHITDLTEEQQNNLRQEVFNYLLKCQGFYFFL